VPDVGASSRVSDCKHGLDARWCALCAGTLTIETKKPEQRECCAPACRKTAIKQVAGLPICGQHYHRLEVVIARKYPMDDRWNAPKEDRRRSWVYFVRIDRLIKIGTSVDPRIRVRSFASYGHSVEVLGFEAGGRAREGKLHRLFDQHRASGVLSKEMFEPVDEILAYIRHHRPCVACDTKAMPGRVVCQSHSDRRFDVEDLIGMQLHTAHGKPAGSVDN
jgi:hypothetical protein